MLVLALLHVATATQLCPRNTTVTASGVVGSGSVKQLAAQSSGICCGYCMNDTACVAYTFEAQHSMCFLKDNVAQCGQKQGATSGVLNVANRTAKRGGGACANEKPLPHASGYNWPPPSDHGSLWALLALLMLVVVGGGALLVRNEKRRRESSFSFPAEQVWHAACSSERSHLPEIVLLIYRVAALFWALFILVDSCPNNAFCAFPAFSHARVCQHHVLSCTRAMVAADYSIWNFALIVCYFALASGHSLWGLVFKRGAASSAPAGLLQQLQLLLFEIELPVRLPAHSTVPTSLTGHCDVRFGFYAQISTATGLGFDCNYGMGLHVSAPGSTRR